MRLRTWTIFLVTLGVFGLSGCAAQQIAQQTQGPRIPDRQTRQNNTWYSNSDSDTVFIFVHGIFSNSNDCWSSPKGEYWPEILKADSRFRNPGIFLGGYYTDFSSGNYKIADAADELLTHLQCEDVKDIPAPLTKSKIVFIAHSTGGLVVRYLIERNQELFKDKTIGLFLLASPSRGSAWANRLDWLRKLYGNKMAGQLARGNDFVMDLDSRFADLIGKKKLSHLVGFDAFENKFIIPGLFFNDEYVVKAEDSASYFGAFKIVPNSDHFSIAKPTSESPYSHDLLWRFYKFTFLPITANPEPNIPTDETRKVVDDLDAQFRKSVVNLQKFGKADFSKVEDDIDKLALNNGHALYFSGEVTRIKDSNHFDSQRCIKKPLSEDFNLNVYHNDFYRYLDAAALFPKNKIEGVGYHICYERIDGYCLERIAWINHLLANDFYEKAMVTSDPIVKHAILEKALECAKTALLYQAPNEQKPGFIQCTPTEILKNFIDDALNKLSFQ